MLKLCSTHFLRGKTGMRDSRKEQAGGRDEQKGREAEVSSVSNVKTFIDIYTQYSVSEPCCGLIMRWTQGWKLTVSRAFMLVLVFSVQAVTHTGRLHRYLPSKGSSSTLWDAEDARRLSCGDTASSSGGSSSSGGDTTTSGMPCGPRTTPCLCDGL